MKMNHLIFALAAALLLLVVFTSVADATAAVAEEGGRARRSLADNCGPQDGLNAAKCAIRRRNCARVGISLKFVGRGCRAFSHANRYGYAWTDGDSIPGIGRKFLRDGGCQCATYCGYLCKNRCNADHQCFWNATGAACYNKATGLIGGPISTCQATVTTSAPITSAPMSDSPSSSPVTPVPSSAPSKTPSKAPSKIPSSSAPSKSPSRTPSKTPSRNPSGSPSRTPSRAPSRAPSFACFHRDSMVLLESGESVTLSDLKHGDRISAFDYETKKVLFSDVVGFTRYAPDLLVEHALRIESSDDSFLIVTDDHVLYASLDGRSKPDFYMAKSLSTKSILYSHKMLPTAIKRITVAKARGWITPLTRAGTVVVNGIAASCHTRTHYVTRAIYTPLHWYLDVFPFPKGSRPDEKGNNLMWFSNAFQQSTFAEWATGLTSK